ncbi:hypothetical protein OAI24_03070 [Alphaproteobacteria bacterium]|nr:hypothetical protein [Alphaproteobacteria bacterium]
MKRLIIALALFMPTSAMAGQIAMDCKGLVGFGDLGGSIVRYSEGIFYNTLEFRIGGLWKEPKYGSHEKPRISDHSFAIEYTYEDKKIFTKRRYILDFLLGTYEITKLTSPDGTDGSWEWDFESIDCSIIKQPHTN